MARSIEQTTAARSRRSRAAARHRATEAAPEATGEHRGAPIPLEGEGEPAPAEPAPDGEHDAATERGFASAAWDGLVETASALVERFSPTFLRELEEEIAGKFARAPMDLNAYGYDPWGFQTDTARRTFTIAALLYRFYFRVQTQGIDRLPAGRMLLIGNHGGQIALDAAMICAACVLEAEPPRIVRGMGEYWLPRLPILNVLMVRTGSVVGTPKNCVDLLEHGEAVIAFPEGIRGMNKSFSERYQLQEFGLGFMRLALQTKTPIVPVAVVGSEEQAPSLGSFKPLAKLLGMPSFPLVLTPIPLPSRYTIYFGEPMHFSGSHDDEDQVVEEKVERVKERIRGMLKEGLRRRGSVFF